MCAVRLLVGERACRVSTRIVKVVVAASVDAISQQHIHVETRLRHALRRSWFTTCALFGARCGFGQDAWRSVDTLASTG